MNEVVLSQSKGTLTKNVLRRGFCPQQCLCQPSVTAVMKPFQLGAARNVWLYKKEDDGLTRLLRSWFFI